MTVNADAQQVEANKLFAEIQTSYEAIGTDFGFNSEAELRASKLASPISVYMCGLDDIARFKNGDDPHKLLKNVKEVIFPIYSGGRYQYAFTMVQKNGAWDLGTLGGGEAKMSDSSRTKNSNANGRTIKDYMCVHVPAMQQLFVGYDQQGKLFLIPCHKNDIFEMEVDVAIPAERAVMVMQPHVEKFRSLLVGPSTEKVASSNIEIISGNGQTYGGGGLPEPMVIKIKDSTGQYVTDLKAAGLKIEVSSNHPKGKYDLEFSNSSRDDKTTFEGFYYVPSNSGMPAYKLKVTVQVKKAGAIVGTTSFEQNIQ